MPESPPAPAPPAPPLASVRRRAAAGALDAAAVAVLALTLAAIPWWFGGFSLPMVGAIAAILGWCVAPLAAFGATAGMRLLGVRMIGPDGERPDPIETAFRELVGRGLLPLSYLVVVVVGVIAALLGRGDFRAPGRFGLLVVLASVVTGTVAALGHLLVLARDDRRGLADLLGRTRVVPAVPAAPAQDSEEQAARQLTRRIFWSLEAALGVAALAAPFILGRPVQAHASQIYADRLMRERAERLFEANPGDPELARDYLDRLDRSGEAAAAQRARERHQKAAAELERRRELKLRESVARNPRDQASADALVELLLEQGRKADARLVYRAFADATGSPRERVRFGAWLHEQGFEAEAAEQLQRALDEGETIAEAYAYLGLSLKALGERERARAALATALAEMPDWEELRTALDAVGGPPRPAKALRDAGVAP